MAVKCSRFKVLQARLVYLGCELNKSMHLSVSWWKLFLLKDIPQTVEPAMIERIDSGFMGIAADLTRL